MFPGNIKWGFTDGLKPVPVEAVQSRWDKEHEVRSQSKRAASVADGFEEYELTSRAVSWPQVS